MNSQRFLNKELALIDQATLRGQRDFSFPQFSIRTLLEHVICEEIYYFESKDQDYKYLGLGKSRSFESDAEIKHWLQNFEALPLVYQGYFEDNNQPIVYLPEWIFIEKDNEVILTINPSIEFETITNSSLFFTDEQIAYQTDRWTLFDESPDFDQWAEMIKQSNDLFDQDTLKKLVLSRKKIFEYDYPLDKIALFNRFFDHNKTSSHFSVFYQSHFDSAFISFTPERLFLSDAEKIETISLAGSIPRGKNDFEDKELEERLIFDDKLIREQGIVTDTIIENLKKYTQDIEVSDLKIVKLPYIQHRAKFIRAYKKEQSPLELINLLHPTPAVGGLPNQAAKKHILEIEKEKRDFYAAPTGIISKNYSEICVGIRSALINNNKITVFGGAGIVKGSMAQEEWHETGTKMRPFTDVINQTHS